MKILIKYLDDNNAFDRNTNDIGYSSYDVECRSILIHKRRWGKRNANE